MSEQLQLLLQYLKDDPRKAVKRLAINDLKLLAKKAPHLWIRENTQVEFQMQRVALGDCLHVGLKSEGLLYFVLSLQTLCECALTSPYNSLKLGMLAVLSTLSGTIAIKQYFNNMTGCVHLLIFLHHSVNFFKNCILTGL